VTRAERGDTDLTTAGPLEPVAAPRSRTACQNRPGGNWPGITPWSAPSHRTPRSGAPSLFLLPRHVFAPYVETYDTSGGSPAALAQESGARYLSLAFLQTAQAGSCTAYWNGDTSEPISASSFGSDISAIQAAGGNVIPSFGGYAADTTGTELADSCTSVSSIVQVYEKVIATYHVPRIDLDIEGTSLTDTAGINRRNEAIAQVESWAAHPVLLGAAARQRRLPRHQGGGHLLGDRAADLVLQPRLRAVHRLTRNGSGAERRQGWNS